ncbi:MAG: S8 family serine peptidase, partial [Bacteroidota bacterium]
MKKPFILFLLVVITSGGFSQTRFPAFTIGAMQVIQKDLDANRGIPSKKIQQCYPVNKINGNYYVSVLCKVNSSYNKTIARENGFLPGALVGNVASLSVPVELFHAQFSFPGIEYMEMAEKTEPLLDGAVPDTRADSVHLGINLPQSYTGKNVITGIVDWGFDYSHPVFYDTSMTNYRVLAAWDQAKTSGPPPAGFSTGTVYYGQTELLAAQADTFSYVSNYHGTHVAGIAGGAGAGTAYRGVGFESDLLFSQMGGNISYSLDAYDWMYRIADSLGKRLVINNSFGSYRNNPLDGTSLFSQAIESYIDSGVVFVVSAANNAGVNFHIRKDFANDSIRTRIGGFAYGGDTLLWGQTITMWGEQGHNFSNRIRILGSVGQLLVQTPVMNTNTNPAYIDTFMVTGVDTIWYIAITDSAHALNGRPQMSIDVKCTNANFKVCMISSADSGTVHYWNTRKTIYGGGNWGNVFTYYSSIYTTSGDDNYGIGHPSVTSGVISAAAHVTNGGITSFSSKGPRMDEVLKPDISAPGNNIGSSLNYYSPGTFSPIATVTFNSLNYGFIRLSGTSMSAPMITGIVSLLLEANPNLTPQQVKDALINTARTDSFTGTIPPGGSTRWGWGKVNAYAAVQSVFLVSVEE